MTDFPLRPLSGRAIVRPDWAATDAHLRSRLVVAGMGATTPCYVADVVAVGAGVDAVAVGDRVLVEAQSGVGHPYEWPAEVNETPAEYVTVPVRALPAPIRLREWADRRAAAPEIDKRSHVEDPKARASATRELHQNRQQIAEIKEANIGHRRGRVVVRSVKTGKQRDAAVIEIPGDPEGILCVVEPADEER